MYAQTVDEDRQQARGARVEFGILEPRQPTDEHDDMAGLGVGRDGSRRVPRGQQQFHRLADRAETVRGEVAPRRRFDGGER